MVAFYLFKRNKEVRQYEKLVSVPEDLIKDVADLVIIEYPDSEKKIIKLFGFEFLSSAMFWRLLIDARQLKKNGYYFCTSYYYDVNKPATDESFTKVLIGYQEKFSSWQKEHQGRPDPKKRPKAPYMYSEQRLCLIS